MKSLGLDAIHFRILTIVRVRFSKVLGRFFRLKIVSLLGCCRETRANREFGKYKGNGNGNMVINNSINPQRQRRM
jgi:hypothetical protein